MKYIVLGLLCAALSCFASPQVKLNNVLQEGVKYSGKNWVLEKNYTLFKATPQNADLMLKRGNWKIYKKAPHICGYNGEITIKLQLPDFPETLKYHAEVTNFADSRKRTFLAEYSINGSDYLPLKKITAAGGTAKIRGTCALKGRGQLLFLRFRQDYAPKDANGRSGLVVFRKLSFTLSGPVPSGEKAASMRPKRLKEVFPTGVCWPWERTGFNAKRAGMSLWQFAEYTMKLLKENGYNTAWFLHFNDDPLKLFALAQKYDFKVLIEGRTLKHFYHGFKNITDIDDSARITAARYGHAPELLGYILKDEPRNHDLGWVNYIYDRLRIADPEREAVFSVMNRQFPMYIRQSRAQVIMTDMYYFFAPRSVNGPNVRKDSQRLLSNALQNAGKLAERHNKHYWFCGQIFQEYWGRRYRQADKFIALPGGYHHWKMPTPAEVRWQAWESLRSGVKGLFFYVLYGPRTLEVHPDKVTDPVQKRVVRRMDAASREAASWKIQPLAEKTMVLPPGEGMIDFDGKPTPQMLATKEVMNVIRKNEKLLLKLRKNDFPAFFSPDSEISTETFRIPGSGKLWGIIVNNNCDVSKKVRLLLPANAQKVRDLGRGTRLPALTAKGGFKETSISVGPGSGALLELESASLPGMPFCDESFDNECSFAVTIGKNAEVFTYGEGGYEMNRALRLAGKPGQPAAVLKNLIHARPNNAITRNLNAKNKDGYIYCLVEGKLSSFELRALKGKGSASAGNTAHLREKEQRAGKSGNSTLLHRGKMPVPVLIPVGTAGLEFYLAQKGGRIDRIRLWFVPKGK